jgi:hypothetical protein
LDAIASVFSGKAEAGDAKGAADVETLHAKIGRRVLDRECLGRAV